MLRLALFPMRLPYLLILAALPSLGFSLFLMQHAQAGRIPLILQAVTSGIAALACFLTIRFSTSRASTKRSYWLLGIALGLVLLPLLLPGSDGPERWINLGNFRLYSAALALPAVLVLLSEAMQSTKTKALWPVIAAILITLALALQPDAAQTTAFVLAIALLLNRAPIVLVLICSLVLAWKQPDPLKPVLYVEGVLELAASINPVALIAALTAIALPLATLLWHAQKSRSMLLFSLAVYYLAIDILAYFQLTPMPLLGYGASPILGYFAMIALAPHDTSRPLETS